jgi:hypothetical protein
MAEEELKSEVISFRISLADRLFAEKVMRYRFNQGLLRKLDWPEYCRYLLNKDATEASAEIKQRRK